MGDTFGFRAFAFDDLNGTAFDGSGDGVPGGIWSVGVDVLVNADLNEDQEIDFIDFLILSHNFGREVEDRAEGDIDGDGAVGFADFLLLASLFGKTQG